MGTGTRTKKTYLELLRIICAGLVIFNHIPGYTLYQTIEGYWLDANTNQQRFRAAQTTVESEQQSYDLLAEKFNLGLTNIIELMNGKDKLLSAQQNRLQSKYQTILNQQLLRFYSGSTPDITK